MVVFGALNASLVLWLLGQGLGALPVMEPLVRLGDVAYAVTLLTFTAWLGLLWRRPARGAEGYEFMIPIAWFGLVAFAVMLLTAAIFSGPLGVYREGAIRHTFVLGFMVPLIVAMAHIVLAAFGTGRLHWQRALTAGFVLVTIAWPLRVGPVLFADAPSEAGKVLLATSGFLVMAGLMCVAASCARTALMMSRRSRMAAARSHVSVRPGMPG
jgi:hypothetical protein